MATANPSLFCDPCKDSGEEQVPVAFCLECRELYCNACLNCHRKMKLTKSHLYVYISGDEAGEICPCDLCNTDTEIVESLCIECRELYCTACTNRHRKFKASKHHAVVEIVREKSDFNVTYSGAQVPVCEYEEQKEHESSSANKGKAGMPVSEDNKFKHGSEPLRFDNTARSDIKHKSLSWTFHCKFSVHTPSDNETSNVNRMISMPDGRICVVFGRSDMLKLYTDDYVLCDEVSVPLCVALTCVDDDTVAVATHNGNITHYSVKGNKITQTEKTLHIDGDILCDIAYRRGEFITRYGKYDADYTCFGSKLIVKQDRTLTLNNFLYHDPVNDCVVLGNFLEHTVTCYTLNGDVKWLITLEGGPTGIVVVEDVVLVADFRNQTIRQITIDGHLLSNPLLSKDHGIMDPTAIAYQRKQQRLLVTRSYDDIVFVFNLS